MSEQTDIVERLMDYDHCTDSDVDEAAAEIARLRRQLEIAREALEKGTELCEWLESLGTIENVETFTELFDDALDAMQMEESR